MRRTIKNGREHLLQDIFAAEFSQWYPKSNDFRRVVVTVKSQKSAKYIMRVIFSWPLTSDSSSNVLDCLKQEVTAASQEWAKNIPWDQKVMYVRTYV